MLIDRMPRWCSYHERRKLGSIWFLAERSPCNTLLASEVKVIE